MTIIDKHPLNRMARVIRSAISDKEIMTCLTPKDLTAVLTGAVENLTPSDVRGFIYCCMTNREVGKGLIMADMAIDFALAMAKRDVATASSEIVGAAVGTLAILAESVPLVKEKIEELLNHDRPEIVMTVIENLGQYQPISGKAQFQIDETKLIEWLRRGAQPTETIESLLKKAGIWQKFKDM